MNFKKIFQKAKLLKEMPTDLEKAWDQGLITEEEFLILKEKRATEEVKEFYEREKPEK